MLKRARFTGLSTIQIIMLILPVLLYAGTHTQDIIGGVPDEVQKETILKMTEKFGEEYRSRIETGVYQTALRWRDEDGSTEEFAAFCLEHFYTDEDILEKVFRRFQRNLEALYGNLHRINREFNWVLHVDAGPVIPLDYLFASYNVYAHVQEDLFRNKIAFTTLLNYPIYSLDEKVSDGADWDRRKWAEARLVDQFVNRIPADLLQRRSERYTLADDYVANYNIYMHNLVTDNGERPFPEGLRLISHWGLRDELKSQYTETDGLERQRMIRKVMERIILQEIPAIVINSNEADWNPYSNEVWQSGTDRPLSVTPEANHRYRHLWGIYRSEVEIDPFTPDSPSLIDRRFNRDREILEEEVEELLHEVMTAPVLHKIARMIEKRLGRPLEPFDIWYNGFKPVGKFNEAELDKIVRNKYPDVASLERELPSILNRLGFIDEQAEYLAERIQVDPSRGAGHAWGARMRGDRAHLRTRVPEGGMDYKGFNIAMHELGHNVEQVFSLEGVDYYTLTGVPNTAFTEAFAFLFQYRDLDVLGLTEEDPEQYAMRALNDMWMTYEIAGVSLLDMRIWRWMYDNRDAGPEELRDAKIRIAKEIWNEYYAPIFGVQDQMLLAIYSHIITYGLYTPDYALGHIIAFQIEGYLRGKDLAKEMERMCRLGTLVPQIWMMEAVGDPISAKSLITAATEALEKAN